MSGHNAIHGLEHVSISGANAIPFDSIQVDIATTANISGAFFYGDGSNLTNLTVAVVATDLTLSSNLIISNLASISGQSLTTDATGQITNTGFQDTITVALSAHGFTQLDAIYNNSGTWTKAQSDDVNTLGVALVT